MENQRVGGTRPAGWGERTAQLLLDYFRLVGFRDPDSVGDAQNMAIDRQSRHAKRVAKHDVRGLPPNTGEARQGIHVRRDLAAVIAYQCLGHAHERLRLCAEESGRVNLRFEFLGGGLCESAGVAVPLEQRRCHEIDALVRRLCREHRRNEQLERVGVVQFRIRVRMLPFERVEDRVRFQSQSSRVTLHRPRRVAVQWIGPGPLFHPTLL